jgi:DNA end-binding protein Ku
MEESDFEDLPVPSTRQIEITKFIDLKSVDPIYFERSYMLEPDGVGVKPFYLLKKALTDSGRVAIAKVSLRQKEHLCCLRPFDNAIAMSTMFYPDEIRGTRELELPEDETEINEAELAMANMLIDQLTGEFEPEQYTDEYRSTLEQVIEAKLGNAQPVAAAPAAPTGNVLDLMSALKASIETAKAERSEPEAQEPEAQEAAPARRARKAS